MKRIMGRILTVLLSALMLAMCCGVTAFAADETVPTEDWHKYLDFNKCSDFSINYNGSDKKHYAFKINNKNYNFASISRTYTVKPNTEYKLSAMVKCTGYKAEKSGKDSGAGISVYNNGYASTVNNSWEKLEISFNTKDNTEIYVSLYNGFTGRYCKGTAYFSDVKLEEMTEFTKTNEWNVLALIFKSVDAPVVLDGKKQQYKGKSTKSEIKAAKECLNALKTNLPEMSDGQMKIKNLDIHTVETTVKKLSKEAENYYLLDYKNGTVNSAIQKYINDRTYNLIIVIAPLGECASKIWGVNGFYNGINFMQVKLVKGQKKDETFEMVFIHELIHDLEARSNEYDPNYKKILHYAEKYGYELGTKKWYTRILRSSKKPFKNGNSLDPRVFEVYDNVKYKDVTGKLAVNETVPVGKDKNIYM